jgi:tetratricopeptide (TPR) repeat protein
MKKIVLSLAMLALVTGASAQKNRFRNAKEYLSDNNYKKALPEIEAAAIHDDTKNNPDVWFNRGITYYQQAQDSVGRTPNSVAEATRSFLKAIELKPDFKGDIAYLYNLNLIVFNQGLEAYNKADFNTAYSKFIEVYNLYNKTKGIAGSDPKSVEVLSAYKDIALNAKNNAALCALNAKKDDDALRLYSEIKNEQSPKDSNTYFAIIEILERQKKGDELIATVNEAAKLWPANKQIRNSEINYYINAGKTNELLPKLETAAASDPNNADIHFLIGNIYERMSFPKGADDKPTARPANADELFTKSEEAYKKAIGVNPNNAEYHYNYGVLYYEHAVLYNAQAMNIKGTTAADDKKVNDLIAKRNAKFEQALPHIEAAFNLLDPKVPNLKDDDMRTYKQAVVGLVEIYSRVDKNGKLAEMKKKYEAAKQL